LTLLVFYSHVCEARFHHPHHAGDELHHEKPVYPLTFEIFPAQEGAQAAFTLYEDEGEDLGYQRDEFVKTPIICSTLANGYELTVSAVKEKDTLFPVREICCSVFILRKLRRDNCQRKEDKAN
jgi:alpha-glucosidase (family GH31 glycosyl hydrolase)